MHDCWVRWGESAASWMNTWPSLSWRRTTPLILLGMKRFGRCTALNIFAVSTAISVLFALAPTYLKYMGHNRATRNIVVIAAVVQVVLLIVLVPRFAATGAAIAYAVSMSGMYLVSSWFAHSELAKLKAGGAT